MFSLCEYDSAVEIKRSLSKKPIFVKIVKGVKCGSIAQILDVEHLNYRTHNYKLWIKGHRKFVVSGKLIEVIDDHSGETSLIKSTTAPVILDFLGKEIKIGYVIVFPRTMKTERDTVTSDVIIATVSKIQMNGVVYAKPIKIGADPAVKFNLGLIRVKQPEKAVILDTSTANRVMFYKLCN